MLHRPVYSVHHNASSFPDLQRPICVSHHVHVGPLWSRSEIPRFSECTPARADLRSNILPQLAPPPLVTAAVQYSRYILRSCGSPVGLRKCNLHCYGDSVSAAMPRLVATVRISIGIWFSTVPIAPRRLKPWSHSVSETDIHDPGRGHETRGMPIIPFKGGDERC